eukprot:m.13727 g.13727  ORF g.13727 m.13727 type:complete len:223 (+) comp25166_c0_seq1:271-939(+)
MLSVDNSSRVEGAWASACSAFPGGNNRHADSVDVLLSTVSLSSSPIFTIDARNRERESCGSFLSSNGHSSGFSDASSSCLEDTERELDLHSDDWIVGCLSDFDEVSTTISSDLDVCERHLFYLVEEPPKSLVERSEHHCKIKSRTTKSRKQDDWDKKHYYQRLLSLSKGNRRHNKRKRQQYLQGLKEKRSGLFKQEQVVSLECSGQSTEDSTEDIEEFLVVD